MKILRIAVILLLAMGAAFAGAAFKVISFVEPEPQTIKDSISFSEESGSVNILLVGIDDVAGGRRADAIAYAMIDIDNKIVRLMSIPRDTRVQIPRRGWDKIAHAYAYGGIDLLRETVVNYLGMPINYHILLNYDTFPPIIDLIGGVEIDVPRRMVYNDYAGKLFINIPKGLQVLDGKNALHFVRFRHDALGDIGRVKRQQDFIKAALKKMQTPMMIPKIPELATRIIEMVKSDMTPAQGLQLASYVVSMPGENIHFFTMPGKAAYISNISYWIGDITAASALLSGLPDGHGEGSGESEEQSEETVRADASTMDVTALVASIKTPVAVLNGAGVSGLGRTAATALQKVGIDVTHIGNARHFDYRTTTIHLPERAEQSVSDTARTLAELLGVNPRLISRTSHVSHATVIVGKDHERILRHLEELAKYKQ